MLELNELKNMCQPVIDGKAYYRPLLCRDLQATISIFIVGINPATPITPEEMDLDTYARLITDYDAFIEYYRDLRRQRGKTRLSPTRTGINGLTNWLQANTDVGIAETNMISYPSQKPKELRNEPEAVIERAKEIFIQVLLNYRPKLIIAHGRETLKMLGEMVDTRNEFNWVRKDELQQDDFVGFSYQNGEICSVLPCAHLRYHGHSGGTRFTQFYEQLPGFLPTAVRP
ncbi:hypothetical protein [Alicyclobacillus sp. ALC3]|uniref:hypothetical protein n=1 Tax=Alicyclobacillus sp. ALC3 TaxID=2796143 RepID=UPI0023791114|nr:hypothetical protein [Alicyclobacillus sp. ALC3]WDL98452.1 hypothetical protein JC200_07150 [Alicyclobacillus sp. ALC3]